MKHPHTISRQTVPRETFEQSSTLVQQHRQQLENYIEQLIWWNERINLVSRNISRETLWGHIRHSLLLAFFPLFKDSSIVVDAGTGGGLPGVPLAITHPDKTFILNDIVFKKATALKHMIKQMGLDNTVVVNGSIANLDQQEPFLLISKHAFKINDLWAMISSKSWTEMAFYKGMDFEHELEHIDVQLSIEQHSIYPESEDDFFR